MHVFDADPATAAAELNEALREWTLASGDAMPSSGPMVFDSWERGVAIHLLRNDNYNGSTALTPSTRALPVSPASTSPSWPTPTPRSTP